MKNLLHNVPKYKLLSRTVILSNGTRISISKYVNYYVNDAYMDFFIVHRECSIAQKGGTQIKVKNEDHQQLYITTNNHFR